MDTKNWCVAQYLASSMCAHCAAACSVPLSEAVQACLGEAEPSAAADDHSAEAPRVADLVRSEAAARAGCEAPENGSSPVSGSAQNGSTAADSVATVEARSDSSAQ